MNDGTVDAETGNRTHAPLNIRRADEYDVDGLLRLLAQIAQVHHEGRPDLFRQGGSKYDRASLVELLHRSDTMVFVAQDTDVPSIVGYAITVLRRHEDNGAFRDVATLYVDDLCVDESVRGRSVGRRLLEHVYSVAGSMHCHNVTLEAWACNPGALAFYRRCGMQVYAYGMERVLD